MRLPLVVLLVALMTVSGCLQLDRDDDIDTPDETPTPAVTATPTHDPTPEPTPTPEVVVPPEPEDGTDAVDDDEIDDNDTSRLQEQLDEIVANVVELRGLELVEELDFQIVTREELRGYLEDEMEIEQDEIDIDWLLRLLNDRYIDLEQLLIDMQVQEILGFYDIEEQKTYLVSDSEDEELSPLEIVIIAHEIVHALQDQHYDLMRVYDEDDVDGAMAYLALVEGDAVLAQELYALRYLSTSEQLQYIREAMSMIEDDEYLDATESVPDYMMEWFTFPYIAGPAMTLRMFDGTFEQIDEKLVDPPKSTRQVLHSRLYLDGEIPDPIEVPESTIQVQLQGAWEFVWRGTTGEFMLRLILEENDVEDPAGHTAGLSGATLEEYRSGDNLLIAMISIWEAIDNADLFERALIDTMTGYEEFDGYWYQDDRYHAILRDGEQVTLISSTDEDALLAAMVAFN